MHVREILKRITIGEGERALHLSIECQPDGSPGRVRFVTSVGETVFEAPAEDFERIGATLDKLRQDAEYVAPHRLDSVCPDHGYYSATGPTYGCPACKSVAVEAVAA